MKDTTETLQLTSKTSPGKRAERPKVHIKSSKIATARKFESFTAK